MTTVSGIGNLFDASVATRESSASSPSLLSLLPSEYRLWLLLLNLGGCTSCVMWPPEEPDARLEAGDADTDVDSDSDVDVDADTDVDADIDGDSDHDLVVDAEADMERDADLDALTDADREVDTERDTDPAVEADIEEAPPECSEGETRESYSGPAATRGHGICRDRIEECQDRGEGLRFYETQSEILPRTEIPNNRTDENCDGFDDACRLGDTIESYSGPPGTRGVGICRPRIETCSATARGMQYQITQTEILPSAETCDGLDNDCIGPNFTEQWSRTYGGGGTDVFYALQPMGDGSFVAAGSTNSSGAGGIDGWLVKVNVSGVQQWSQTYGGTVDDIFYALQSTSDGGVVAAGESSRDGWLVRVNGAGVATWNRIYESEGCSFDCNGSFHALLAIAGGGFVAAGTREDVMSWHSSGWLLRIDGTGTVLWDRTFGEGGVVDWPTFYAIQLATDGSYITAGELDSDGWLLRAESTGGERWDRSFSEDEDSFRGCVLTSTGGIVAAGSSYAVFGTRYGWVFAADSAGTEQWRRTYGSGGWFYALQPISSGGYVVAGSTTVTGRTGADGWLVKINGTGVEQWNRTFGDDGAEDYFYALQPVRSGGFIAAGSRGTDAWLMRFCEE